METQPNQFIPSATISSGPETSHKAPTPDNEKPSVEWLTEYFQKTGRISAENSVLTIESSVVGNDCQLNAGSGNCNIHPFKITY